MGAVIPFPRPLPPPSRPLIDAVLAELLREHGDQAHGLLFPLRVVRP